MRPQQSRRCTPGSRNSPVERRHRAAARRRPSRARALRGRRRVGCAPCPASTCGAGDRRAAACRRARRGVSVGVRRRRLRRRLRHGNRRLGLGRHRSASAPAASAAERPVDRAARRRRSVPPVRVPADPEADGHQLRRPARACVSHSRGTRNSASITADSARRTTPSAIAASRRVAARAIVIASQPWPHGAFLRGGGCVCRLTFCTPPRFSWSITRHELLIRDLAVGGEHRRPASRGPTAPAGSARPARRARRTPRRSARADPYESSSAR